MVLLGGIFNVKPFGLFMEIHFPEEKKNSYHFPQLSSSFILSVCAQALVL